MCVTATPFHSVSFRFVSFRFVSRSIHSGMPLRKEMTTMCHLYKIVHGFVDFPNAPLLFKPCTNYYTRHAHHLTLLQPQTHTNAFYFSFFSHAVSIWNSLPYIILTTQDMHTTSPFCNLRLTLMLFISLFSRMLYPFGIVCHISFLLHLVFSPLREIL